MIGAIIVALLLLFPSWSAHGPKDPNLWQPLGFAWAFSPPAPPPGSEMLVERDSLSPGLALSVAALAVFFWWFVGSRKSG